MSLLGGIVGCGLCGERRLVQFELLSRDPMHVEVVDRNADVVTGFYAAHWEPYVKAIGGVSTR